MRASFVEETQENFPWLCIGQYPPLLNQKENSFLSNNGAFVLAYEIELPEVYTLGKRDFESINQTWERALKSLPSGTIVHKQDYFFENEYDAALLPQHSFLEKATAAHFSNRAFLNHRTLLFFSSPLIHTLSTFQLKFALQKIKLSEILKDEDFINEVFVSEITKAVDYLNSSLFFKLTPLSELALCESSQRYLNLCDSTHMTTSGLFNQKKRSGNLEVTTTIGDNIVGMYALCVEKEFSRTLKSKKVDPEYSSRSSFFFKGLGDHFGLHVPFSHIYNQILIIDHPSYWIKALEKRKEKIKSLKGFTNQLKAQYERLENLLTELYTENEEIHFIRAHFNVTFWEYDKKVFQLKSNQLSSIFKALDLNPTFIKGKELGHLFLNSHFANVSNFSNHHLSLLPLTSALCLFSSVRGYKSDKEGLLFNDRLENIPVKKDVWDASKKRIKARNFAIFAPTGEGKSVLANHLIRGFIDSGYKVVIVDLGGSYEKLCHLYPEKSLYYKFNKEEGLASNPFFISSFSELTSEKIESLTHFILLHNKKEDLQNEMLKISLKMILRFYYEKVFKSQRQASLPDFIAFVNSNKELICKSCELNDKIFDFQTFKHLTSEFTSGGTYSFLYSKAKEKNLDFKDKSLIVADLDALKDNPLLLSIYLSMLNDAIDSNIWEDKTKRGVVLYDEFAKSLAFEGVLDQVIYFAQAIRKQNGALGIILQSINQLPDSELVRSMIENIQVIYSLKNQGGYKALVERLNLNEHAHYQLQSLKNNFSGKIKYSEFWMRLGNESNVYRLELPPKALYAYLSEGEENQEILNLYKETGSMEEAIKKYEYLEKKRNLIRL